MSGIRDVAYGVNRIYGLRLVLAVFFRRLAVFFRRLAVFFRRLAIFFRRLAVFMVMLILVLVLDLRVGALVEAMARGTSAGRMGMLGRAGSADGKPGTGRVSSTGGRAVVCISPIPIGASDPIRRLSFGREDGHGEEENGDESDELHLRLKGAVAENGITLRGTRGGSDNG